MKQPFKFGAGGAIGDNGLTGEDKKNLGNHITGISDNEKKTFLDAVSIAIDKFQKSQIFSGNNAETIKRIAKFSNATHGLVSAIDGLKGDPFQFMGIYFDECIYASKPKMQINKKWLNSKPSLEAVLYDLQKALTQLEVIADYTNQQITVSKGNRLNDDKAKQLALEITKIYQSLFGVLPPYARGTWFANFMAELGELFGLTIGDRSLTFAHNELKT